MDTLPTRPEINREKEDRKSGLAGFFSRLLGGGGSGAGGLGGVGGAGGMGAGAAGGLLATKAGIIGLVLIGTTVAGGVGVVGYKVFGPGADESIGSAQSLFEARPASERSSSDAAGAAGGAAANSLQFLVDANNRPAEGADGAVADGAASDSAAAEAPASQTVTASGSSSHMGADGKANATGAGAAASKLAGGAKFGSMSKSFGGGGSGASSGASSATGMLASSKGNSSAFAQNKNRAASAAGGAQRALASRRGGGAMRQLMGVRADHRGNRGSSQAHGSTYDGSAGAAGSGIGGGSDIAGGGQGTGAGVGDSAQTPQQGLGPDDKLPNAPPSLEGVNATPYQKALNTALLMIVGSLALTYIAGKLADTQYGKMAALVLGGIAAVMAGYAFKLGMDIGGDKTYGQPMQGGLIAVAAAFAMLNAGLTMAGSNESVSKALGDTSTLMKLAGGGAMLAMAGAFLVPMKTVPASEFENGKPPDGGLDFLGRSTIMRPGAFGSEDALPHYLASGRRSGRAEA